MSMMVVDGGLFSISILTLSIHSIFKSEFPAVILHQLDEVDDDVDGGLASRINEKLKIFLIEIQ